MVIVFFYVIVFTIFEDLFHNYINQLKLLTNEKIVVFKIGQRDI